MDDSIPHSGNYDAVFFSGFGGSPTVMTQPLPDVFGGQCCVLSFYLLQDSQYCNGNGCVFQASVGSNLLFDSNTDSSLYADTSPHYVYRSASFTKADGDVLSFMIQNQVSQFFLDDISITCTVLQLL